MNPMEMIKQMVMNKIGKNMNPMQQNLINSTESKGNVSLSVIENKSNVIFY